VLAAPSAHANGADLPSSAAWAIGLLVGIELLFAGSGLIMTAVAGRRLAQMR
jgi:uncharacterized membrane protein HdeD (DUF308 family)